MNEDEWIVNIEVENVKQEEVIELKVMGQLGLNSERQMKFKSVKLKGRLIINWVCNQLKDYKLNWEMGIKCLVWRSATRKGNCGNRHNCLDVQLYICMHTSLHCQTCILFSR